jgi:anaerobic ribonucleoside-triphosphate reductase
MSRNIPALLQVIDFIYENIVYAEINTKSDYCKTCGFSGEIKIIERNGRLGYECPFCGERRPEFMNVSRRVCGKDLLYLARIAAINDRNSRELPAEARQS